MPSSSTRNTQKVSLSRLQRCAQDTALDNGACHAVPVAAPLTRRDFLEVGSGAAAAMGAMGLFGGAASAAGVEGVPRYLPRRPDYLYIGGRPADFAMHVTNEGRTGKFNMGGVDLNFGHGAPLLSPANGIIVSARQFRNSGKNTKIDYGLVRITISHQRDLFVDPYQGHDQNLRDVIIGRQGKSGSGARVSHVHITVYGNAVLCADKERRLSHSHNFLEPDGVRGRFGLVPARISDDYVGVGINGSKSRPTRVSPYYWNFILDPDHLTPNGDPLHKSFRDPAVDYDTPYLSFVDNRIVGGLRDLASEWERRPAEADRKFGANLNNQIKHWPLYTIINTLWVLNEMALKNRTAGQRGFDLRTRLEALFDDVREAAALIKLTCPYINPDNPNVIETAMIRNPEREDLVRAFYGRFLPTQIARR